MASVPQKPQPSPTHPYGDEVGRDGQYISYANGIVKDSKTGLEWIESDKYMTWDQGKVWVGSLNVGGGGWRMPTLAELRSLYRDSGRTALCKDTISPLFKGFASNFWYGNDWDSARAYSVCGDSVIPNNGWNYGRSTSKGFKALAVRSRGDG